MAEPFAAGVLSSLLQPRVPLARVTRSTGAHSALAANFFTPLPRQSKHKARATDAPPAVGHILEYQAWAYPPRKQSLWGHDGFMRTTLMGEIEPAHTRGRVRRPSKSSRPRFHKSIVASEKNNGQRRYHVSHSSAVQPARDFSGSSFGNGTHSKGADEQPVASTSAPSPPSPLVLFQEALESGSLASDHQRLSEQFSSLEASGRFTELPSYELLVLAELLAEQIDSLCIYQPDAGVVYEWGQRLRSLADLVDESASPSNFPVDSPMVKSIFSRSAAFMGNFMEPPELDEHQDHPAPKVMNSPYLQLAYTSRILSLSVYEGIAAALDYLFIESSLKQKQLSVDARLEDCLLRLFTRGNMRPVIAATAEWDPAVRNEIFDFVLLTLSRQRDYAKSFNVILEIRRGGAKCPSNLLAETCKGLASTGEIEMADEVLRIIPRNDPHYTALRRYVNLKRKPPDKGISKTVGREVDVVYGTPHFPPITMERFNLMYPKDRRGIRTPRPTIRSCGSLMSNLYEAKDYQGGIELWEDMKFHGIRPDLTLATQVMHCYFNLEDTLSIMDTMEYLKKVDFKGDNIFYTSIVRFLGFRMDSTAAAAVHEEAIAKGIVPDKWMYRSLMRAYFRSGDWKEAIALFTKLRDSSPEVMDIHIYNTILQGCVFMGGPFRTLFKMFMTLEKKGLVPNKYTYAVLTRGALDSGQFAFVEDLYDEIMSKQNWRELVDVAFFTNVITGYVRMGKRPQAKLVLDKMGKLGIKPTPVTHAAIIKAYAEWDGGGGMVFAEKYLRNIVENTSSWKDVEPGTLRKDPLALMYGPIIDIRCARDDVKATERLVGEYLNHGGTPTIGILKALLGLYGRLNRLDDFRSIWNRLLELAVKPYRKQKHDDDKFSTKMRTITAPVDIYTHTISKACLHSEVAQTWRELSSRQHDFDASNWHAFAHACLRAGQIENAFQIMEHSFQPRFNNALRNHFRKSPPLDATHEDKVKYYKDMYSVMPPRPLIEPQSRVRAARINKAVNRNKTTLTDEQAMAIDFAFPLTLLRRIGPSWHDWKPRFALLESLLMAMLYLEDGFPIRAMLPGEECAHHIAAHPTEDRSVTELVLKQLHENHPRTMHRLRRFRYKETLSLGQYGFRKKYLMSR